MKCVSPIFVRKQKQFVPCGKCAFCIKKRIDGWCVRLRHEMEASSSAFFITLTYAIEPQGHDHEDCINSHLDHELCKRDLTLFIKRLRKENEGIRYYAIGEYGGQFGRPHYHLILFNLVDLQLITDNWKLGHIKGDRLTLGRIRYVVQYMAAIQDVKHKQPPFAVMSRNPGIGSVYIDKMKHWHRARSDAVIYDFDCANSMPRFYRDKIFIDKYFDEFAQEWREDKGPLRMLNIKHMNYSLDHPQEVCYVEHEKLLKKLQKKSKR